MTPQCTEPDLQMTLLEVARSSDAFEPTLAEHLEGCSACQTAIARLRRMLGVWSAEGADADAIAVAAARFAARGPSSQKRPSWQGPLSSALVGAAAGVALLIAARAMRSPSIAESTTALPRPPQIQPSDTTAQSPTPRVPLEESARTTALATPHIEGPHGVVPLADGVRLELKAGESAHVALADGQSTDLRGPCVVEFWSSPTQVGGWRLSRQPTEGSTVTLLEPDKDHSLPEPAATALPDTKRAWASAAEALRKDDFAAADRAFAELGHDPDPATRDAARLARAQLWIAHGRAAEVRPVLEELAQHGATELVRQRAAEFLSR